ncbi:MAG: SRPBCC family protein [Anaerolineae bacterium]
MSGPRVAESKVIDAPPAAVYDLLADYRVGHPQILPKPYFQSLVVEQGGRGAGTIVRVTMSVMGSQQTMRLTVTEPSPGRVLQEEDATVGVTTWFTVTPLDGGARSQLQIATEWRGKPGLGGWIEGRLTRLFAPRIYRRELDLIAQHFAATAKG